MIMPCFFNGFIFPAQVFRYRFAGVVITGVSQRNGTSGAAFAYARKKHMFFTAQMDDAGA